MIRPWYRSRLFWLGIPGLLFLLWAWWDSNSYHRAIFLSKSSHLSTTQGKVMWFSGQSDFEHELELNFRTGKVTVYGVVVPPGMHRPIHYFVPWAVTRVKVASEDQVWFPPPRWQARDVDHDTQFRLLVMPYWLLAAGYAAAWLGATAAWQRRKSRLLKAATVPPP